MSAQQRNLPRWRWWEPFRGWKTVYVAVFASCSTLFGEAILVAIRRNIQVSKDWESLLAGLSAYFSADRTIFSAVEITTFMVGVFASAFLVDSFDTKAKDSVFKEYYYFSLLLLFAGFCLLTRNTIAGLISLFVGENVLPYGAPWASFLACFVVYGMMGFHRDNSIFLKESKRAVFRSKVLLGCMRSRLDSGQRCDKDFSAWCRWGMKIFWSKFSFLWIMAGVVASPIPFLVFSIHSFPQSWLGFILKSTGFLVFFMLVLAASLWLMVFPPRSLLGEVLLEAVMGMASVQKRAMGLFSAFIFLVITICSVIPFGVLYGEFKNLGQVEEYKAVLISAASWPVFIFLYGFLYFVSFFKGNYFLSRRVGLSSCNGVKKFSKRSSLELEFNSLLKGSPGVKRIVGCIAYRGGGYVGDFEERVAYFVQNIYQLNPRLVIKAFNDVEKTLNDRAKRVGLEKLSWLDVEGELYRRGKSSPEIFSSGGC